MRLDNIAYSYFLALSLALHLALVPLLWRKPFSSKPVYDPISVSFLPESRPTEPERKQSAAPPRSARRGERAQAKAVKRATTAEKKPAPPAPQSEPQTLEAPLPPELPMRVEQNPRPMAVEPPSQADQASVTHGPAHGEASIFKFKNDAPEKPITRGDLLPGRRDLIANHRAIPLNTSDVRYAPYTQSVKQWIEARWEYPDLAKQYGLQGRVVVEFTILQNGHIELLALVRSSGSRLLDEEAVRAIKAAVPFKPFPRSIQESSLRIIAGFIYSDQRLRVSGTQ